MVTKLKNALTQRLNAFNPRALPNVIKPQLDVGIWLLSVLVSFAIRFEGAIPLANYRGVLAAALIFPTAKLIFAKLDRLHLQSWTRVSFRDLGSIIKLNLMIGAAISVLLLLFGPALRIPRSIAALDMLISMLLMVGVRATARFLYENFMGNGVSLAKRKNVLIIGAGEAGTLVAREMLRHPEMGMKPIGFLDDDVRKANHRIATVPVLGGLDQLQALLRRIEIDEVLISLPSAGGRIIREIVDQINDSKTGVTYRVVPGMYELLGGKVDIKRMREVEIQDLLGRPPVKLDTAKILGYLEGKTVMITGAGGSIGSEIVRQVCRFNPKELILFGHGENSVYSLERELDRNYPDIHYRSVIGAIQNGVRLDYIFRRYRPEVIFHTAAHKHVPLMELNPEEAVFNNIVGSKNLVNLALKYGVSHFVNISTDKAVNPTSVMGASKRMVELIVQEASRAAGPGQTFVSVRFGNVLGSRGSVIPVFKQQIAAGGPVTVTHPDMVRYFMTIPEACQLVLQASGQGKNGDIYILDMGEPVKIVDLARDLIKLSGFEPDVEIPIVFTGMRPGEKMYEELMTPEERGNETVHEKIYVARVQPFSSEALEQVVHDLQQAALQSDHRLIRELLERFIVGCRLDYSQVAVSV
jgi:FlaA1/EpsC-like NDP-sugar epimerase